MRMNDMKKLSTAALLLALPTALGIGSTTADAALTYSIEAASGWPNQAHYDAAVAAVEGVLARYNAYAPSGFGNYNVYVYYDQGIPTAQASYGGSIGFGGTYPNLRVTQHEMGHYLGLPSGSWSSLMSGGWSGPNAAALIQQFDGDGATINGDSIHFWPYGLNYDSEWSEIASRRQVALVYAMRADLGIGSSAHPSTATTVTMSASDAFGTSAFNYQDTWDDGYFAHGGAVYYTGDYMMRTPASASSFTFAGDSLTINNTNGASGGLIYKGTGTNGVVTINDLRLDGGWVQHLNGLSDKFKLDGSITVLSDSVLEATQGDIYVLADISGSADLTIETPPSAIREDNRYVRILSGNNSFTGDIINKARFELADGANFVFDIGASGVNNAISGSSALTTLINGVFEFDLSGATSNEGDSWSLVTAANTTYGSSFEVAGFDNTSGVWSNGSYLFNQSTGLLTLVTQWDVDGGGNWSVAGNWSSGLPLSGGDATLGSKLTGSGAPATINMDAPATLNRLTIDNANTYTISGANALTLTGSAQVSVKTGAHEIAAPIAGSAGLNKTGAGSLTLSTVNTYSGDTNINEGTLKLAGAGSIANSANINVQAGATFDVSGTSSTFQLASGQTLNNNSDTTVIGDVIAGNGSTVTGDGTFADNLTMQSGSTLQIGGVGLPVSSTAMLIDNFDSYDNSSNQNIGAHGNGDVTGGVWDGVFDGTNNGQIVDNTDPADNALVAWGIPSQGAGGWRGGVTDLSNNFATDFSLADGETATYFFQVMNEGNGYTDTMIGLTESLSTLDINDAYADYSVMPYVVGNPGSATLSVYGDNRSGGTITALTDGQWQNVWLVVDNANKTFDVYTSTGADSGTLALAGVEFGRMTDPFNLEAFGITNREDGRVRIDNLYQLVGENTQNPLAAGGGALYSPEVLTVLGDVVLEDGSVVTFDIATSGVNDLLDITGSLKADGTLEVVFGGVVALQLGDTFDLFDFASASGGFDSYVLPTLDSGLYWDTSALLTTGVLAVVDTQPTLVGDLNGDGFVGLDDLDIVLSAWNQNVTAGDWAAGDPSGDGYVGLDDIDFVLGNWNAGTPAGASAAIPEPASVALIGVGGLCVLKRRRGR